MDRNSADLAAQALKTKMLAERSWKSPLAFQRSQKPKAMVREEKGEQSFWRRVFVSIAYSLQMEDKEVVSSRGHLRTYSFSSSHESQ